MNIIFMGTPDFAVPALYALINAPEHTVVAVYSQPPRPAGRGHHAQQTPVHQVAEAHNIPVYTPTSLKTAEDQERFLALGADIAVVAAYGLLLPTAILEAPRYGCINIHSSLLPRWRGAAPIQRAIMAGDTETGVTIMHMDKGLDTGAMLLKRTTPITLSTTASALHDTLAAMGAEMVLEVVHGIASSQLVPVIQDNSHATYAEKLSKEEGMVDWTLSAVTLDRYIRALNPWPGMYFVYKGERIKIVAAEIADITGTYQPGEVVDDKLTIGCGKGALRPTLIQRPGKKAADTDAVLRGFLIGKGERL